jgi:hypothetical protein
MCLRGSCQVSGQSIRVAPIDEATLSFPKARRIRDMKTQYATLPLCSTVPLVNLIPLHGPAAALVMWASAAFAILGWTVLLLFLLVELRNRWVMRPFPSAPASQTKRRWNSSAN